MNIPQIVNLIADMQGCMQFALTQRQIFVGQVSVHEGREEREASTSLSGAVRDLLQYIVAVSNRIKALTVELRRLEHKEYDEEKKQKITAYIVKVEEFLAYWDNLIDSINKGNEPELQRDEEGEYVVVPDMKLS
jgi:reverse gyrase